MFDDFYPQIARLSNVMVDFSRTFPQLPNRFVAVDGVLLDFPLVEEDARTWLKIIERHFPDAVVEVKEREDDN